MRCGGPVRQGNKRKEPPMRVSIRAPEEDLAYRSLKEIIGPESGSVWSIRPSDSVLPPRGPWPRRTSDSSSCRTAIVDRRPVGARLHRRALAGGKTLDVIDVGDHGARRRHRRSPAHLRRLPAPDASAARPTSAGRERRAGSWRSSRCAICSAKPSSTTEDHRRARAERLTIFTSIA